MTRDELWERAMELGALGGCHQRPERSFFIGGYQFPVCARCTGVLVGQSAAFAGLAAKKKVPFALASGMLLVMGADWFAQYTGICGSTNIRRLVTGIIGGAGIVFIYADIVITIINLIRKRKSV
ncbi:MAG: DUF2085 domain-containing protein [Ruminiclostridium sp.]|nr:DUF2085 domain-containing protein [Ruminiclostridium sp.]